MTTRTRHIHAVFDSHLSTLAEDTWRLGIDRVDFWDLSAKKVIEWRLNFLDFSRRSFLWWPGTIEAIEPEFTASKIMSIILIYRPISRSIPQRFQNNSCSVETSLSSNEKKILEPMGLPHIQRPLWNLGQNWHFPRIFNRVARVKFF